MNITQSQKQALRKTMLEAGYAIVHIDFYGGGDEGTVEQGVFYKDADENAKGEQLATGAVTFDPIEVDTVEIRRSWTPHTGFQAEHIIVPKTYTDLSNLAYDIADQEICASDYDWSNNEGGNGYWRYDAINDVRTFVMDVNQSVQVINDEHGGWSSNDLPGN